MWSATPAAAGITGKLVGCRSRFAAVGIERMSPSSAEPRARKRKFAPWSDPAARPLVRFEGVTKRFLEVDAVDRLSLDIFEGDYAAIKKDLENSN